MGEIRNILFVMYDQLRWDYLGCAGHPHLTTPHWDALAARGVRFTRAYCQSPICGASRMSFYTGRYVDSHGASHNLVPLKAGEVTVGDHLRALGMDAWLVGKTHMKADDEGMRRLGIDPQGEIGARVAECGFDVWERDDGMRPEGPAGLYDPGGAKAYNEWLRARGYDSENPWHDFANASRSKAGALASGWFLKNSAAAAAIEEEDSETPYLTTRAMEFMQAQDGPWMCHLSYIKPHWPYIAPEPYASMFGRNHVPAAVRAAAEREDAHPVFAAFQERRVSAAFSRDEVREAVIPAYMGLVKQCDDQFGRLIAWMEATGRMQDTMIVVTSDHGDYLGDHWMGEKDLFHDCSARIPLIVYDPREAADAARGSVCDALVEGIDLGATFIEAAGGEVPDHIVEGRSLRPFLEGRAPETWRKAAISEYDYGGTPMADKLGLAPREAALVMVFDGRWKAIFANGFRPMLFDLEADPDELADRGADPGCAAEIARLEGLLRDWSWRKAQRTTVSDAQMRARRRTGPFPKGVLIGVWDEDDIADEFIARYVGDGPTRRGS